MNDHDSLIRNLLLRADVVAKTNWLQAVNILEKAIQDYPRERSLYLHLGDLYARKKSFEQAINCYQQALTIDPKDEHLFFILGNCYLSIGDYIMARAYYDQVQEVTPELMYNMALSFAYSNQHEESIKYLEPLMDIITDNVNIYYFYVDELLRLNRHEDALKRLDEMEAKFGVQHHQQVLKGFVYHYKKIWLKSFVSFRTADELQAITNADHLHVYAISAWQLNQLDKATEILQRAIHLSPFSSGLHEDLIRIYIQQQDYAMAEEALNRASKELTHLNPILLLLKEKITDLTHSTKAKPLHHE